MKQDQTQVRLSQKFNLLEPPFRPDVRWWLAEGLNTDKTLEKNIQQIHASGAVICLEYDYGWKYLFRCTGEFLY